MHLRDEVVSVLLRFRAAVELIKWCVGCDVGYLSTPSSNYLSPL
jgi:hypothetical protein